MGIDVFVARNRAAEAVDDERATPREPASVPDAAGPAHGAPADEPMAERAAEPAAPAPSAASLDDARALLDDRAPAAGIERPASESDEAPSETASAASTEPVPRFRLQALRCGLGLLLVDEAALPDARRETLLRLGDLLRGGLAVRGADLTARIETQAFFWPQVEAAHVDQSRPRAEEALTAWVRRCTNDGEGFLVLVEGPAPSSAPLGALEALPVRRARVAASFLAGADPAVHRDAWRALDVLAVAGP